MTCLDMVEPHKLHGVHAISFGISDDSLARWDLGEVVGLIATS